MADQNFSTAVEQQSPRSERAQKGGLDHLGRMLETITNLASSINEQTNVVLCGGTDRGDDVLVGVQHLARQVGYLASCVQQELGHNGAETNPLEWLCPNH